MADIGKLSVQVSASSKAMAGDMRKAADDLSAGAEGLSAIARAKGHAAGRALSDGIRRAASLGSDAYLNPAKMFGGVISGMADFVAKIPVIGGLMALPLDVAAAGISAGIGIYEQNAERIKALGVGAAKSGLDVGDIQLLSRMTGGVEQAAHAWAKLQQHLAEAEMAGEGARTVFDKFGIDGKALAVQFATDFDGALGHLADRISSLPSSMRMKAVRDLAGRGGAELLPTLMKGSAGIAEERDRMNRMGLGVDGALVANVKQAEKAKKEISGLWEGFGNQITMAVAPALAIISEKVGKLPMGFAGLGETIVDTVGGAVAFVADMIDGWTDGNLAEKWDGYWETFKGKAKEAIALIGDEFQAMITNKFRPPRWLQILDEATGSKGLREMAGDIGDAIGGEDAKRKAGLDVSGKGLRPGFKAAIADHLADEVEWEAYFGPAEDAAKGKARKTVDGFLAEWRGRMKGALKDDATDPLAKLNDRINKLNDASKGPLGEFNENMNDLATLLKKVDEAAELANLRDINKVFGPMTSPAGGIRPLEDGAAELSAFAAYQKLKAGGGDQHRLAGALEQGSAGAYSAIAQFESQRPENVQVEMKRLMEFAQRQRDEQIRVGKEAAAAFRNLKVAKF